ncbi:MAG: hypothetical protein IT208_03950 [Chthonomonadales bacterium]|nr:hypothetical protein [Chthonomonadales bacterium]
MTTRPEPARVAQRDIVARLVVDGETAVSPSRNPVIAAILRALVEKVDARVGEGVTEGPVLVEPSFPAVVAVLEQARRQVKAAQTAYANARNPITTRASREVAGRINDQQNTAMVGTQGVAPLAGPGMRPAVAFVLGGADDVLAVPSQAVDRDDEGNRPWIVTTRATRWSTCAATAAGDPPSSRRGRAMATAPRSGPGCIRARSCR